MKKTVSAILVVCLVLGCLAALTGCGSNEKDDVTL